MTGDEACRTVRAMPVGAVDRGPMTGDGEPGPAATPARGRRSANRVPAAQRGRRKGGPHPCVRRQATGIVQGKRGRRRVLTLPLAVTSRRLHGQPGGKADGGPLAGVAPGGAGIRRQPPGHSALSGLRPRATPAQTACSSQAAYFGSRPRTAEAYVAAIAFVIGPGHGTWRSSTDRTEPTSAAVPHTKISSAM